MKAVFTVILCMAFVKGMAQEDGRFSLALKVGGGWSGWHTDYNGTTVSSPPHRIIGDRFVPAYAFGLSGKYVLVSRLGINVELLYLRGGSKYVNNREFRRPDGTNSTYRSETTLKLSSLRTPIYLSWDFSKGKIKPYMKIGASSNWILQGNRSNYDSNPSPNQANEVQDELLMNIANNKELLQDWSFFSGVGINFQQRLLLEANLWLGPVRYYAFTEPAMSPSCFYCLTVSYRDRTYHNRAIMFTLTYLLLD